MAPPLTAICSMVGATAIALLLVSLGTNALIRHLLWNPRQRFLLPFLIWL